MTADGLAPIGTAAVARPAALALAAFATLSALLAAGCVARRGADGAVTLAGGPRALVREPSHDFGVVEPGTVVKHRFEIANVGDQAFVIRSVAPGCGCTAAVASDRLVPAGGVGAVEVSLDTWGLSGKQAKAVRVRTSDPSVEEVTFVLHGEVAADVSVSPRQVYLGRVGRGDSAAEVVDIVVQRSDVAITGVKSESGQVEVAPAPLDPPQQGIRLRVTLRSTGTDGRVSDRVVVETTSARQPKIAIPVLASIEEGTATRSATRGRQAGRIGAIRP